MSAFYFHQLNYNALMKQTLILASSSIYRRELLQKLQIPFSTISPKIDETPLIDEKPHETALRLAQEKAKKISEDHPYALIIGCDQVATLDGEQLGKPGNHKNAVALFVQCKHGKNAIRKRALLSSLSAVN
jgi:predicted house-cleaning NTP pyrophosphatase (Maf/HAM1 superfamily)